MKYTETRSDIQMVVKALRPIMLEVYRKNPELAQAGFVFDRYGNLSCPKDKELVDNTRTVVSMMGVANFAKEYGRSFDALGYRVCDDGDVVPIVSPVERFTAMMINPFEDNHRLVALEDYVLRVCLKKLADTRNREIMGTLELLQSNESIDRLIVAAPWRIALSRLYTAFANEQTAVAALEKAEPIQVLGLVMMARIFADHLNINPPFDWFSVALTSAYVYAKKSYSA